MERTINRVAKDNNYSVTSNFYKRDSRLSLKAKGLLDLILSFDDYFDFNQAYIQEICRDGRRSVASGIKELEDLGYLEKRLKTKGNLKNSYQFIVYEIPKNEAKYGYISSGQNVHSENHTEIDSNPDYKRGASIVQNVHASSGRNVPYRNTNSIYIGGKEISENFDKEKYDQNFEFLAGMIYMQLVQVSLKRDGLEIEREEYISRLKLFMGEMVGTGEYSLPSKDLKRRWFYWLRKKLQVKSGKRNDNLPSTQAVGPAYRKLL